MVCTACDGWGFRYSVASYSMDTEEWAKEQAFTNYGKDMGHPPFFIEGERKKYGSWVCPYCQGDGLEKSWAYKFRKSLFDQIIIGLLFLFSPVIILCSLLTALLRSFRSWMRAAKL